jgi:haloalkane dehalogenase
MTGSDWINRKDYPFTSQFFETDIGKMHYLDEGEGSPIVFVHGNPSWSYQYRNVIKELSKNHRCIAPDMIGFGLSDKPADWSYLPKEHSRLIDGFLESLDLEKITLVVGDWGGPIGLSYAIKHSVRIKNIVITNTWLWSVKKDWYYQMFSKFAGGPIGKILIYRRNLFARDIVKAAFGDKKKLTKEVHEHYLKPLENKKERKGSWVFPREIIGSSKWLGSLWDRRSALEDKNILIAWGMKDIAFKKKELKRWSEEFPNARVVKYSDAGHFVGEERPEEFASEIRKMLKK